MKSIINKPLQIITWDNVLDDETIVNVDREISTVKWPKLFNRAGSRMYECGDIHTYGILRDLYIKYSSPVFLQELEVVTGITGLIPDPYLHGAGYSQITDSGDLKPHIDFNWNDRLKLYRALTFIIYLTTPERGGEIEFINVKKISVRRNLGIIFEHSEKIRHFVHPVIGTRNAVRFFYYTSKLTTPQDKHRSLYGIKDNIPCDIK